MMWYGGNDVHWWAWLLGSLMMVAFWGLIIWAVWYLVASLGRRPEREGPRSGQDPRRILDERLARGEIDSEEYRRLRDLLGEKSGQRADGETPVTTGGGQRSP